MHLRDLDVVFAGRVTAGREKAVQLIKALIEKSARFTLADLIPAKEVIDVEINALESVLGKYTEILIVVGSGK